MLNELLIMADHELLHDDVVYSRANRESLSLQLPNRVTLK